MTLRPRLAAGLPFRYIAYYIYPIGNSKTIMGLFRIN